LEAAADFTILAEARSRLDVDQETLPLKIGPEKMVHKAMAATHRNSKFAGSFCCRLPCHGMGSFPGARGAK
jgi:hypothetical protein